MILIGVKILIGGKKWSTYRGYWTDYVNKYTNLIISLDSGGTGQSSYQDYTPVMSLILHRWNDE